jgi:hypothetical protein
MGSNNRRNRKTNKYNRITEQTRTEGMDLVEEINYQAEDTLKARWKGYEAEDDTLETIHMAAWCHKTALKGYLKQVQDEGLQGHLQQNSKTRFYT